MAKKLITIEINGKFLKVNFQDISHIYSKRNVKPPQIPNFKN